MQMTHRSDIIKPSINRRLSGLLTLRLEKETWWMFLRAADRGQIKDTHNSVFMAVIESVSVCVENFFEGQLLFGRSVCPCA